jgi:hypothetical protein
MTSSFLELLKTYERECRAASATPDPFGAASRDPFRAAAHAYATGIYSARGYSFVAPTFPQTVFLDTHSQRNLSGGFTQMLDSAGLSSLRSLLRGLGRLSPPQPLLMVSPTPVVWTIGVPGMDPTSAISNTWIRDPDWWFDVRSTNLVDFFRAIHDEYFVDANGTCIIFSGDFHWGYVSSVFSRDADLLSPDRLVQLTSSAIKNRPSSTAFIPGGQMIEYPGLLRPYYLGSQTGAVVQNHIAAVEITWTTDRRVTGHQKYIGAGGVLATHPI